MNEQRIHANTRIRTCNIIWYVLLSKQSAKFGNFFECFFSQDKEFRAIIVVSEVQIRQAPEKLLPFFFKRRTYLNNSV